MRKATILFVFLLLATTATAIIPTEEINGVKVKFWDESQREQCTKAINAIPSEYLNGVQIINVRRGNNLKDGMYYFPSAQILILGRGCGILTHELAHHRQWVKERIFTHNIKVRVYESEIIEAIRMKALQERVEVVENAH